MTNNHKPITVLKQRQWQPSILKCHYPLCCNFFTTIDHRGSKSICGAHRYDNGRIRYQKQKLIAMLSTPYPKVKSVLD